jgi:uncharacterized protein Yka (UPF0111/DUF47 family)
LVRKVCLEPALANQLELDPISALDTQSLVQKMEEVADNAANIAKQLILLHREALEIPELIKELLLAAGKYAVDGYSKAVETFFSQDTSTYAEIVDYQKNAGRLNRDMRACAFLSSKSDPFLSVAMCSIGENIKRIAECATNIAEIAILRFHKPEQ